MSEPPEGSPALRVTETLPATHAVHDLATAEGRAWLDDRYAPGPDVRVRLNMITALTGAAAGPDGTSETLTSRTDRAILRAIRATADAVVVGAATVRAEGYVLPRTAPLVVVTTTGDLSGHRLADPERVLLVCPSASVDSVRERAGLAGAEVVGVAGGAGPGTGVDPREVTAALAERGLLQLVCEGGPAIAALFAGADLIDEYCVTVAPALLPAARPFLDLDAAVDTEVAGMLVDDAAFSYLRLRPRRSDRAPAATR